MGLFSRISSIVKGKTTEAVEALEDRNLSTVIKQSLREAEEQLRKNIEASAQASAHAIRLENQLKDLRKNAENYGDKAKTALNAGNEELARRALEKQTEIEGQIASLEPTVNAAKAQKEKLQRTIEKMKSELQKRKAQGDIQIARHNAAKAQQQLAQTAAGLDDSSNAFARLDRLEEKIKKDEAVATAYEDMAGVDDDLDSQLDSLSSSSVDDKLAALKAQSAS